MTWLMQSFRYFSRFADKQVLTITDAAASRIKEILSMKQDSLLGIRIGVRKRGCNGMSYTIDYATEPKKFERVVDDKGVKVFVDPKAELFVVGTEMDYYEDDVVAEFVFRNPNAKGKCGCGESFNIDPV